MQILLHYPQSEEECAALACQTSMLHAEFAAAWLENLPCPAVQKLKLLEKMQKKEQEEKD